MKFLLCDVDSISTLPYFIGCFFLIKIILNPKGYLNKNGTRCNRPFFLFILCKCLFEICICFFELDFPKKCLCIFSWFFLQVFRTGHCHLFFTLLERELFRDCGRMMGGEIIFSHCSLGVVAHSSASKFFLSILILPCICTVFTESFVYVFAIKTEMLS